MENQLVYATGKRKTAIARVRMVPGEGKYEINKKPIFTVKPLK
jgi:ribosomal protein S9